MHMPTVRTAPVKYVFLDVVRFTHKRSVEAQADIVDILNEIVRSSVMNLALPKEHLRFLHTGDGICIAIQRIDEPYDVHVLLAVEILSRVAAHNANATDDMRRFELRVGVNANVDNVVLDINEEENLAGAGINIAQRVMNVADGGQILVGRAVHETLAQREKYMNNFRPYTIQIKHGQYLSAYQYVNDKVFGLNSEIPEAFVSKSTADPPLTRIAAYYIAHAFQNRDYLVTLDRTSTKLEANIVLLYLLAEDSIGYADETEYDKYDPHVKGYGVMSFEEQLAYYDSLDFWCNVKLAEYLQVEHLSSFADCFEHTDSIGYRFVSARGLRRVQDEWPQIASQFGFARDADVDVN
jgi:class 3 adenylate cyclase